MWYFAWILGIGLACSFAILNAMWFEMRTTGPVAGLTPEFVKLRFEDKR